MISKITLGELLTHSSADVRRHATGAFKALQRHEEKITAQQDNRMDINAQSCKTCGLHPSACRCLPVEDEQLPPRHVCKKSSLPPCQFFGCGNAAEDGEDYCLFH